MGGSGKTTTGMQPIVRIAAGEDLLGERRGLGINTIDYKVSTPDGSLFVVEITCHVKGGPGRHIHYEQEEWFYALEGEFDIEVGQERFRLHPGDSLLAPRKVPHVWAYIGSTQGRLLAVFTPAGQMEAFFRETTKAYALPPQDPAVFRAHGMELVGPPLTVE